MFALPLRLQTKKVCIHCTPPLTLTSSLLSFSLFLSSLSSSLFSSLSLCLPVSSLSFPVSHGTAASSFPYLLCSFPHFLVPLSLCSSSDLALPWIPSFICNYIFALCLFITIIFPFFSSHLVSPSNYLIHLPSYISQMCYYSLLAYLSVFHLFISNNCPLFLPLYSSLPIVAASPDLNHFTVSQLFEEHSYIQSEFHRQPLKCESSSLSLPASGQPFSRSTKRARWLAAITTTQAACSWPGSATTRAGSHPTSSVSTSGTPCRTSSRTVPIRPFSSQTCE